MIDVTNKAQLHMTGQETHKQEASKSPSTLGQCHKALATSLDAKQEISWPVRSFAAAAISILA